MRLLTLDRKRGVIKAVPETLDDLWVLEKILVPGDVVKGVVTRRVKREGERGAGEVVRIWVAIEVKKAEFHEYSRSLRITGTVLEARPEEYVGKGKHQTIEITPGKEITIEKTVTEDIVQELRAAEEESKRPEVTIVSIDDEDAHIYVLSQRLEKKAVVKNPHHGKRVVGDMREFYGKVREVVEMLEPDTVVVGGPGFFFEEFIKFVQERGTDKRYSGVRTAMSGEKGVFEIVHHRGGKIIEDHKLRKIMEYVEQFLERMAKGEPVAVGAEIEKYVDTGAVEVLLLPEKMFAEEREKARALLRKVHEYGGKAYIVPDHFEPAETVRKLGGVALLRFR